MAEDHDKHEEAADLKAEVKKCWVHKGLDISADCFDELRAASQASRLGLVRVLLELGQQVPEPAASSPNWVEGHGWKLLYRVGQPYSPTGTSRAPPAPGSQGCTTGPRVLVWQVFAAVPLDSDVSAEVTALVIDLESAASDAPVRGMLRCSVRMLCELCEVSVPPKDQFFWRLSEEEDGLFAAEGPFIVLGRSGTGKTQTMLYRILHLCQKGTPPRVLFVTHSETLPGKVREHYSHLRWHGAPPEGFDVDLQGSERPIEVESKLKQGPIFTSFPTMMRLFDSWSLQPFIALRNDSSFVDLHVFENFFWPKINKTVQAVSVMPAEAWQEILTVIKGSIVHAGTPGHIERKAYIEKVGNSILQKETQRKEAWAIFEAYEGQKRKERGVIWWDRCDLAHSILSWQDSDACAYSFGGSDTVLFDHIFVDEVQDLTQTELAVLFRFAKDSSSVIMAGDTCQTVSAGINFRFAELRSTFDAHQKHIAAGDVGSDKSEPLNLHHLSTNYRSQSGVVQLSNCVLQWLGDIFPFSMDVLQPAVGLAGGPAPVVHVSPNALDDFLSNVTTSADSMLQQTALGATQAVIVVDEAAKKRVPHNLQNSILLTVSESKGLEFDDVILFDFFADTSHLEWNLVLLEGERLANVDVHNKNRAKTCTGLKMFYVAVTRAKRGLLILEHLEQEPVAIKQLLKQDVLQSGLCSVAGKQFLRGLKSRAEQVQSIADWMSVGKRLRARRVLEPAMMCFERAGDAGERDLQHCLALQDFMKGNYALAAKQFLDLNLLEMGANCFLKNGQFQLAAEHFLKAGKLLDAAECLRSAELFDEAETLYAKVGAHGLAFQNYLQLLCRSPKPCSKCLPLVHPEMLHNPGLDIVSALPGGLDRLKALVARLEKWHAVHLALRYGCFVIALELLGLKTCSDCIEDELDLAWLRFQIKRDEVRECSPEGHVVSKRSQLAHESHELLMTFLQLRRATGFLRNDYRHVASLHRALDYILDFCDNAGEETVLHRMSCWRDPAFATLLEAGQKAPLLRPGQSWRREARLLVDDAVSSFDSGKKPWARPTDGKLENLKKQLLELSINSPDEFEQISSGGTFSETLDGGDDGDYGAVLKVVVTSVQHQSAAERLGLEVGSYSIVSINPASQSKSGVNPSVKFQLRCLERQFDLSLFKELKRGRAVDKSEADDRDNMQWRAGALHLVLLSEGESICEAVEENLAEELDTRETIASSFSLKPSFSAWLKDALAKEVDQTDVESLLCSVEILLSGTEEEIGLDDALSSTAELGHHQRRCLNSEVPAILQRG